MQFSKYVSDLARTHGVEPRDVLFSILLTAGASAAESFAVIFRPTVSTSAALTAKASNYIGQRPGLKRLIKHLDAQRAPTAPDGADPTASVSKKRGRPRKEQNDTGAGPGTTEEDKPRLDYTDKDAVLQELARIAERCEKESDRLAAIREISALQRMKQEAKTEADKRVTYYIPLTYDKAEELRQLLSRYFAEKEAQPVLKEVFTPENVD